MSNFILFCSFFVCLLTNYLKEACRLCPSEESFGLIRITFHNHLGLIGRRLDSLAFVYLHCYYWYGEFRYICFLRL